MVVPLLHHLCLEVKIPVVAHLHHLLPQEVMTEVHLHHLLQVLLRHYLPLFTLLLIGMPPPPPPPGMGGVKKVVKKKPRKTPETKMKGLQWAKIPDNKLAGTIFS